MTTQAPKQTPPDELVGRVINDRFRIISVIARGGMGRVYRAEQVPLGRLVAIKTLDPRYQGSDNDPQFQQRFFLEASVASKLQHPNTVTVFDYGRTADGIYFIAMELVEGHSLLSLVRQEAPLPAPRVVHIAIQIARSLREAHRLDVIHRDLKPANVLLTHHGDEDDFVKVLDFGLVKHVETEQEQELTMAGLFMGSPKYMSPEQIRGERVDARADIYALGVVMYEMITGRVPFDRDNTVKVLMAHLHEPVPAIEVEGCPDELARLVMRCLGKDREQRPGSMDEIIGLLKQTSGGQLTVSGSYSLSQEIRLPPASSGPIELMGLGEPSAPPASSSQPLATDEFLAVPPLPGPATVSDLAPSPPTFSILAREQRSNSSWLPKVAVIGALVIAAGFLALKFSEKGAGASQGKPDAEVATEPAPPATALPGAEARAASTENARNEAIDNQHVRVKLDSKPSGAVVTADGKTLGQTPADIEWWGELAVHGRQITFTFEKEGYETITVIRTIRGETLDVEASLPRARRRHRSSPDEENERTGSSSNDSD